MPDKANELAAIEPLLKRLGAWEGLKRALVSIDAIATNATVAKAITNQEADYLLALKANHPTLRAELKAAFAEAGDRLETHTDLDKSHGRIKERRTAVLREVDWLEGGRHFPGELRLPGAACLRRAETRVESLGTTRTETRDFIALRALAAAGGRVAMRACPHRRGTRNPFRQPTGRAVSNQSGLPGRNPY